jgi:DNA mismatch endonuclease (patch repair protein)
MVDRLTPERRSALMSRVGSKNTTPEMIVRRIAHRLGYRFRLHRADLPGTPDLVFPSRRKVVFVHGCFWHRHPHCRKATMPKSRVEFWSTKFSQNVERDEDRCVCLEALGWETYTIWECETKQTELVVSKLVTFLERPTPSSSGSKRLRD